MERAEGRVITPGPWLDLPSDPALAGKIMGNGHYEVEGVPIIEKEAKPKAPKARPKRVQQDPELSENSDGWE